MPGSTPSVSSATMHDCLRCSQRLAQLLDHAPDWTLCGLRWSVQRFHYCWPVEPDYRTGLHEHEHFEVNLLCQGRLTFRTPEHTVDVGPGDVYFMPSHRMHAWSTVRAPVVIAGFHIRVSPIDKAGQALLTELNACVDRGQFSLKRAAAFTRIHQNMWELLHQDPPSPLLGEKLRSMFELFSQELIERTVPAALLGAPAEAPAINPDTVALSKYQQIVEFIDQNIRRPIQLEDIARHFDYSVRHVARLFRKESGVALGQYILERKLRAAQSLLATTDQPVKAIALDLGYRDVGYFCRLFRTHMMGTPNGYRTSMLLGRTASPDSPNGHHSFRGYFRGHGGPKAASAAR